MDERDELIRRLKSGDRIALELVMAWLERQILRSARTRLQNEQDAEDVLQEVSIQVWMDRLELPNTWREAAGFIVGTVARRRSIDEFRRQDRRGQRNAVHLDESFGFAMSGDVEASIVLSVTTERHVADLSSHVPYFVDFVRMKVDGYSDAAASKVISRKLGGKPTPVVIARNCREGMRRLRVLYRVDQGLRPDDDE